MTAPAPARACPAVTRRLPGAGLDGGALSVRAWLLLAAGTAGGLAFTGVYLAEGATRAGYQALAQPISALSLGPGGWVQQLNFIVFGVLVCASAAGWRSVLAPGRGGLAFPVLRVIAGVGLVMDGLFSQDHSGGYPPEGSWENSPSISRPTPAITRSAGTATAPRPGASAARQPTAEAHTSTPKTMKFSCCTHPPGPRLSALIGCASARYPARVAPSAR